VEVPHVQRARLDGGKLVRGALALATSTDAAMSCDAAGGTRVLATRAHLIADREGVVNLRERSIITSNDTRKHGTYIGRSGGDKSDEHREGERKDLHCGLVS
jgi:hypothetical protein